eukprot:CAMPEP_0197852082 /NCGR_PEP_ID=MMETSP1438-20131217/19601_1 /TAXON_ID=1461541 /ORGANISM="Pterosperma sp., Strain CCMP1384" /LENGTH=83 /DNA_ID=CAMNT_0043465941 /DNA_START=131 /DNA_END=382 /DNA_ORIENTATION=+
MYGNIAGGHKSSTRAPKEDKRVHAPPKKKLQQSNLLPRCSRTGCNYAKHKSQGHGFCCNACKDGRGHGILCARQDADRLYDSD